MTNLTPGIKAFAGYCPLAWQGHLCPNVVELGLSDSAGGGSSHLPTASWAWQKTRGVPGLAPPPPCRPLLAVGIPMVSGSQIHRLGPGRGEAVHNITGLSTCVCLYMHVRVGGTSQHRALALAEEKGGQTPCLGVPAAKTPIRAANQVPGPG